MLVVLLLWWTYVSGHMWWKYVVNISYDMWWAYVGQDCGRSISHHLVSAESSLFLLGSGMMIMVVKDQSPDHNSSWRNVCPGFARWAAVLTSGLYRFAGRTLRRPAASITFSSSLNSEPLQSSQTDQHNWCCVWKHFSLFLFLFPPFTIFSFLYSFSSLIFGPV